jgi:pilus assembly protein Flp/PilA
MKNLFRRFQQNETIADMARYAVVAGTVNVKHFLRRLHKDESGAALVEYALLVFLIAVASIVTLTTLGTTISGLWTTIGTKLTTAS